MAPVSRLVVHRPSPALRPHVARYLGYVEDGHAPGLHRGLPSGSLTLAIGLDAPLDLAAMPNAARAPGRLDAAVGGLHRRPVLIRHPGRQVGVHLDVTPLGCRALFGLPAAAIADEVVGLDELLGPAGRELVDRLRAAPGWPARFRVLDDVLGRRAAGAGDAADPTVARAWRRLEVTGGRIGVAALAQEVGWSRRHLTARFQAEVGLTPKVAARVIRFERVRRALATADHPALATLAAEAGYADQAHLTREFGAFAGCSPLEWLATDVLAGPPTEVGDEEEPARAAARRA
ncbi:MAG TPA: helix-turn-helix domain-containing protein [Aquihabitans sp.]|nr:helix-turn-helix domain-containing protein [Aquihabitans sp.]